MAPVHGADFDVLVETTPGSGTYVAVNDMDNFDETTDAPSSEFPVFGNVKYQVAGVRAISFTVSGFRTMGDSGQGILLAAEKAGTSVKVKVLYDGTNGFTIDVFVKSRKGNAKAEGLQTLAYDFLATGTASTAVGTGPAI